MLSDFFKFDENNTDLKTEIIAGITTFIAMAYILGVNPAILSDGGMSQTGVFFATAVASGISCIIMGLVSRYPIAIAPGMGYNALLTYTIILNMGKTWETALAAVFVSSIIFLLISISRLREFVINAIPADLKLGIGAGIGLFLAFIGLQRSGIIISNPSTLISMGSLISPHALLALIGILITLVLYVKNVPASVFLALIITSALGLIFTFFGFGVGDTLMPSVPKEIITTSFDTSLIFAFTRGFAGLFSDISNLNIILFSLVSITFFDSIGTVISLAKESDIVDENGQVPGIEKAFLSISLGGIIGSIFGTSTLVAYLESASGIGLGGRTGLTALTAGICFFLSLFFAPLILSLFTSSVTASALVIVGIFMIVQLKEVNWNDKVIVASVFMTILLMVSSYSISVGIAWGFVTFAVASIAMGRFKEVHWGIWLLSVVFIFYLLFGL